jgi:DNA repair protein RecO (recombination protein O)
MDNPVRDRLCRCFVLHRRDFGNTSLLIEVFSAEEGRLPVLAKGAKRGRRSTAADLQPFRPLWLGWVGRGEVKTLIRTEPAGCPIGLPGTALFCGFYLNELLMRLVGRHDPHEGLFAFYHAALAELAQGAHLDSALRRFELRLLREVGYAIILDRDAFSGESVLPGRRYAYEPEAGVREDAVPGEGFTVSGETLLRLAAGEVLQGVQAREARELLHRLLSPHLGERPLKSRELFRQWRG